MTSLRATIDGRARDFPAGPTITVGRVAGADIHFDDRRISRTHVLLHHDGHSWVATDRSSGGTWIDDERIVGSVRLGEHAVLRLGPAGAPQILLETLATPAPAPTGSAPPPAVAAGAPPFAPSSPTTAVGRPDDTGTIAIDDRLLRIDLSGAHKVFAPGSRVVVGRDPSCDVVTDNRLVSAHHCQFTCDGSRWWIEDLGSTRGTFIDHKRITGKTLVEGAFFVYLGDDDAGEPMRVVTAGEHRAPVDRRPFFLAVAALVIAVLAAVGFAIGSGDPDEAVAPTSSSTTAPARPAGIDNTVAELAAAKLGTVFIGMLDEDGAIAATGSGALVAVDGTVLTNAHVAFPRSWGERVGQDEPFPFDPQRFLIRFVDEDDSPRDEVFFAEPLELHPSHDIALLRIVEDEFGAPSGRLPAEPLPLGRSDDLRSGDAIAVIGYPGQAFTSSVSVSRTNFQSFAPCGPFVGDPYCQEDFDRGWLNLAGETLGAGSSGGPIVRFGRVVGVQQGVILPEFTGDVTGQELAVPIDIAVAGLRGLDP